MWRASMSRVRSRTPARSRNLARVKPILIFSALAALGLLGFLREVGRMEQALDELRLLDFQL